MRRCLHTRFTEKIVRGGTERVCAQMYRIPKLLSIYRSPVAGQNKCPEGFPDTELSTLPRKVHQQPLSPLPPLPTLMTSLSHLRVVFAHVQEPERTNKISKHLLKRLVLPTTGCVLQQTLRGRLIHVGVTTVLPELQRPVTTPGYKPSICRRDCVPFIRKTIK